MLTSIPVPWQAILWPLVGAALVLGTGRLVPDRPGPIAASRRRLGVTLYAGFLRILASATALAAVAVLWSLRSGAVVRAEIPWSPINLFRVSPMLLVDGLALLGGLVAATVTAAFTLGIRESVPHRTAWHGLLLILLAGCLGMAMAADFLTLALGSALIDLALIAMAASDTAPNTESRRSGDEDCPGRAAWWIAVPGVASTLLLFASAIWMDAGIGTASLLARQVPPEVPVLAGIAGLLRLVIFPLHPRRVTSRTAANLALMALAGILLLARVQALPGSMDPQNAASAGGSWPVQGYLVLAGGAVLAGGLMASATALAWRRPQGGQGPTGSPGPVEAVWSPGDRYWLGTWLHQSGVAVVYLALGVATREGGRSVPFQWPLVAMPAALGLLAIWWDAESHQHSETTLTGKAALQEQPADGAPSSEHPGRQARIESRLRAVAAHGRAYVIDRVPFLDRERGSGPARGQSGAGQAKEGPGEGIAAVRRVLRYMRGRVWLVVPFIGLASLAGLPLTAGAQARWSLYARLLHEGRAAWLLVILVADTLLVAGLWTALSVWLSGARSHPPQPIALLSAILPAGLLMVVGIAPGWLPGGLDLEVVPRPPVSTWGLGVVYALPWLLGSWLARVRFAGRLGSAGAFVRRGLKLEWMDRPVAWAEERLLGAVFWLGQVGEGEGWWGWALIILSMGTLFLAAR